MNSMLLLAGLSTALLGVAQSESYLKPLVIKPDSSSLVWGNCPSIFSAGCEIAVLHGDPSKPNADVFLRIAGGAKLPAHWHSSAERMMLSTGELRVQYEGSESAILRPGTYAYGPAKQVHEAECVSAQPCTLFIAFEGPVDAHAAERLRHR